MPPLTSTPRMSIEECRAYLDDPKLSDNDVRDLRDRVYGIIEAIYRHLFDL